MPAAIEIQNLCRWFGSKAALDGVSMIVEPGEIHALLGPNGAGKTTLLRILIGLMAPSSGIVRILGRDGGRGDRLLRRVIGSVPSGDRTFYMTISGMENLVFFGRLYGMRGSAARKRADVVLDRVGLRESANLPVGRYSHGMHARLAIARALLHDPAVLLIDEATHHLDPENAHRIRELVRDRARRDTAIVWTTQRIEEVRGFADTVTLLNQGKVTFSGSVSQLMTHATGGRFVLRIRNGEKDPQAAEAAMSEWIGPRAEIRHDGRADAEHFVLSLGRASSLGDVLAILVANHVQILACDQERSPIEEAFLRLVGERSDPALSGHGDRHEG